MYNVGVTHERVFKFFTNKHDAWLREAGINYQFIDQNEKTENENISALITVSLTKEQLARYPNLQAVVAPIASLDQLDLDAIEERGLMIYNTSAHAQFVAERALSLTLAVLGKIVYLHKLLEAGDWAGRINDHGGTAEKWTTLYDRKVAIYGYGRVGEELHKLLEPFRANIGVLSYKDRNPESTESFSTLAELAGWCDVLIVCAPLNSETEGSIDQAIFSELSEKVLINIGRGPIINEDALYESLKKHQLKGFGSDVWYNYPTKDMPSCKPSKYALESFAQVVMTPHNGGTEEKSDDIKYMDVAEQLAQISKGNYSRKIG